MVAFDDPITDLTGFGSRVQAQYYEPLDVQTVGDLIAETNMRRLRRAVSSQYEEDAQRQVLQAAIEEPLQNFDNQAHARLSQWGFVSNLRNDMRGFVDGDVCAKQHVAVGRWQEHERFPSARAIDSPARTIVPTHRDAQISDATRGPAFDDGTAMVNGATPAFYISSEQLATPTVSADIIDGRADAPDTIIPANAVSFLGMLFDTTPPELLDDARFAPDGPVCFSDNDTGLDVLVAPLPRPDTSYDFDGVTVATNRLAL